MELENTDSSAEKDKKVVLQLLIFEVFFVSDIVGFITLRVSVTLC